MASEYSKVEKEQPHPRMSIIYPQDLHDMANKATEPAEKAAVHINAEDAASPLSSLFMTYLNPIFKIGFARVINSFLTCFLKILLRYFFRY